MKKILVFAAMLAVMMVGEVSADLIISGVVDGTRTGGNPKAIELYALNDIADLSVYSLIRDTNGAGAYGTPFALSGTMTAGSFLYIAGNADSASFLNSNGFTVFATAGIASINGDDILGIGFGPDPVNNVRDMFGQFGQGDTNFYQDSFAIRNAASFAPNAAGEFDAANFTITGYTDSGFTGASGFGTFAPVPEPSALLLVGSVLGAGFLRRRRS